jgi:teichuronic acid exporter
LSARAYSATAWSAAEVLLRQGVQFGVVVVLARLITPEEFGTIALLSIFVGIAGTFVEGGLSAALIQLHGVTRSDESTVFWFNILVAAVIGVCLAASGTAIASLFGKPVLTSLTVVLAANIPVTALGAVHRTLFIKHLQFRPLVLATLGATVVSGAVAIVMAASGSGVWALAAQAVAAGLTETALLWLLSPWRPLFVFSLASAKSLFRFGSFILASGLLDIAYSRLYSVLIGKFYGTYELGQYTRAESTVALPTGLFMSIVGRVAFPAFSGISGNAQALKASMRLGLQSTMLVYAPATLGLAAVADQFVVTVFGEAWRPAAPIVQVLCLSGLLMPLHLLNLQILMALGRSDLFFRLEVQKKLLGVAILCAASAHGPIGMAWGVVIAGVLSFFINASYTKALCDYGHMAQLRDVVASVGLAAVMALVVWVLDKNLAVWPSLSRLAIGVAAGAFFYLLLIVVLRIEALRELKSLLRSGLPA